MAWHEAGRAVPLSLLQESKTGSRRGCACRRHGLGSPGLEEFVGLSFQYADYQMRYGQTELARRRSSPP